MKPRLFQNMNELARQFGVTAASLRQAAKDGKLPGARRIGGRWYVHSETLVKYFETAGFKESTALPNTAA